MDFAIQVPLDGSWQARPGSRHTAEAGATRLFHRWQGRSPFEAGWEPAGVAMRAFVARGEDGKAFARHQIEPGRFGLFDRFAAGEEEVIRGGSGSPASPRSETGYARRGWSSHEFLTGVSKGSQRQGGTAFRRSALRASAQSGLGLRAVLTAGLPSA